MPYCVSNYIFRDAHRASTGTLCVCVCVFAFTFRGPGTASTLVSISILGWKPFKVAKVFSEVLCSWACALKCKSLFGLRLHKPSLHRQTPDITMVTKL